jgi:hypothetical protein
MTSKEELKIALVAGASHALKYKNLNPKSSDEEAIQHVSRQSDEILSHLQTED